MLLPTSRITSDPMDILWHYAHGYMPDLLDADGSSVGWVRWSHRGVQYLDKLFIPKKQRPYVNSKKFEVRYNIAFEEVIRACADTSREAIRGKLGKTWITEELVTGLLELHRMGYAHSYESWQDGQLVGGVWGIQLGGFLTMSSMFHRVSNGTKPAFGRSLKMLKERGFALVDMGMVPEHLVDYGIEWVPRWKFEAEIARLMQQKLSLTDDIPAQPIPWQIRLSQPIVKVIRAAGGRLGLDRPQVADRGQSTDAAPAQTHEPEDSPTADAP